MKDDRSVWEMRLRFGPGGVWVETWGPTPAEPNCEAPTDLVAESPWRDMAYRRPVAVTKKSSGSEGVPAIKAATVPEPLGSMLPPLDMTVAGNIDGLIIRSTDERRQMARQLYPELLHQTAQQRAGG